MTLLQTLKTVKENIFSLSVFVLLIIFYVLHRGTLWIVSRAVVPLSLKQNLLKHIHRFFMGIITFINPEKPGHLSRSYLIELSIKNMKAKKTRTFVTMGGMAIGIAFIVFLVSVGYGLQKLVITRVTHLGELKQADVVPGTVEELSLNDATLAKFSDIPNVETALPVIAVVGRVSYHQSISDMAVYGVNREYLSNSAIHPVKGDIFEDKKIVSQSASGSVAGVSTEDEEKVYLGDQLGNVSYQIESGSWVRVREYASSESKLLGYTRQVATKQQGEEVVGDFYPNYDNQDTTLIDSEGKNVSRWLKTKVPLWQMTACDQEKTPSCEDGRYLPLENEDGGQVQIDGYIAELSLAVLTPETAVGEVLGETTALSDGSLPVVSLASESASALESSKKVITMPDNTQRVAVINRAVLEVLNLSENEAVGQKISLSFVVVGDLAEDSKETIESAPVDYTIVGITPDDGTPMIYVPFTDIRSLGIDRFSQIRIIVKNSGDLAKVRSAIEAAGYGTVSVADTVAQIDKLFASFRLIMGILGFVALSVAALGMFNTLTVSLLERTREVGLMKAMGMKSNEVKELFLTESVIMGFFGGVAGLISGIIIGKIVSLLLTTFSLVRGVGVVDISYVPPEFVILILILSIVVGVLTGYFPAKRATRISALNALRYE